MRSPQRKRGARGPRRAALRAALFSLLGVRLAGGAAPPVEHPVTAAAPVGPVDSLFNSLGGPAPPREKEKESKHWKRIQHEPVYKQPAVLVASSGGVGTTMLLRRLRDRGITTNHPTDADGLKHAQYPPDMPSVTHAIYLFGDPVQAHASLQRRNMLEKQSKKLGGTNLGDDPLGLEAHLENWRTADAAYPILFVRYERLWDLEKTLGEFLGVGAGLLPEKRERKTNGTALHLYSHFRRKLATIPDQWIKPADSTADAPTRTLPLETGAAAPTAAPVTIFERLGLEEDAAAYRDEFELMEEEAADAEMNREKKAAPGHPVRRSLSTYSFDYEVCSYLEVDGTEYADGTYERMTSYCDGEPYYFCNDCSSSRYIWFSGVNGQWAIGNTGCGGTSAYNLASYSSSHDDPSDAGTWLKYDNGWVSDYGIDVDCKYDCSSAYNPTWVADGMCDSSNNVAPCYDGGDCCAETCLDTSYSCSSFSCLNPKLGRAVLHNPRSATRNVIIEKFMHFDRLRENESPINTRVVYTYNVI